MIRISQCKLVTYVGPISENEKFSHYLFALVEVGPGAFTRRNHKFLWNRFQGPFLDGVMVHYILFQWRILWGYLFHFRCTRNH